MKIAIFLPNGEPDNSFRSWKSPFRFHSHRIWQSDINEMALYRQVASSYITKSLDQPMKLIHANLISTISLGENKLTGTVPLEMESLPLLETFHFHGNNLTGNADLIVCNATDTSLAIADAGADCLEEVECSCCRFCCDDKICCDRPENGEGDWKCAGKQRRLLDNDLAHVN
jgi:hypothetical protein